MRQQDCNQFCTSAVRALVLRIIISLYEKMRNISKVAELIEKPGDRL